MNLIKLYKEVYLNRFTYVVSLKRSEASFKKLFCHRLVFEELVVSFGDLKNWELPNELRMVSALT